MLAFEKVRSSVICFASGLILPNSANGDCSSTRPPMFTSAVAPASEDRSLTVPLICWTSNRQLGESSIPETEGDVGEGEQTDADGHFDRRRVEASGSDLVT